MKLSSLTPEELLSTPVWRYRSPEGDDRAEVDPSDLTELTEDSEETFIALTHFTLSDGTRFFGYCSPVDPSGLDYIQPVLIAGSEHIRLWEGFPAESIAALLQRSIEQVFPISFECRVPVDGSIVAARMTAEDVGVT